MPNGPHDEQAPPAPAGSATPTWVSALTRILHAVLVLAVLVALVLEIRQALSIAPGAALSSTERLIRLFSYFTIQSNLVVALASALMVIAPRATGRWQSVARLDGLLCIALTGAVYHAFLSGYADQLAPAGQVSNSLMHTVTPIGCWLAWLLLGPRPRFRWSTVAWSLAYPVAWLIYTFIHGAISGWYPYPFLDVASIGLGSALANTIGIAVGFLALAAVVRLVDRVLPAVPIRT